MKLKQRFMIGGMVTAITCALVGSISGTFAWYGYSTRATAGFTGTGVAKAENLQIGIVTTRDLSDYNLKEIEGISGVQFGQQGGGLRFDAIAKYLELDEQNPNQLQPVTSGEVSEFTFDDGYETSVGLTSMPIYQYNTHVAAAKTSYVVLPLALRAVDLEGAPIANKSIYISDITLQVRPLTNTNEVSTLDESFRFELGTSEDNSTFKYRLINPKATEDGAMDVAGLLDMDHDGYADVEDIDYEFAERKELVYGWTKIAPSYGAKTSAYSQILDGYNYPVHLPVENHKSKDGVLPVTETNAKQQYYLAGSSVRTNFDENGKLKTIGAHEIVKTNASGVAYVTIKAWLEGWDEHTSEVEHLKAGFNFGIQFQIDLAEAE